MFTFRKVDTGLNWITLVTWNKNIGGRTIIRLELKYYSTSGFNASRSGRIA